MGENMNAYMLVRKPKGITLVDGKGVDNIRMDLGERGWGGVNWIGLLRIGTNGGLL
jgi:hypothetical protein